MSKYGYTGGRIKSPEELAKTRMVDPFTLHAEQGEQQLKEQQQKEAAQRFKSRPIFKVEKKAKWHDFKFWSWRGTPIVAGLFFAGVFWGPIVKFHLTREVTDEERNDRDILIRKAFSHFGDRWWSVFIPYRARYMELQKIDYFAERDAARADREE